jgi:DNA-directed RNA polymerase specialized sigma24 family protein
MDTEKLIWIAKTVSRERGGALRHHDREDLYAELLLALVKFTKDRKYDDDTCALAFGYLRIAAHRWWRKFSKRPHTKAHIDLTVRDPDLEMVDLRDTLSHCCQSDKQAAILEATIQGYTASEIAELFDMSPPAVSNMRSKLYRRIRRCVQREES